MRAHLVAVLAPALDQHPRPCHHLTGFAVRQLVPQPAVRFRQIAVIPRTVRLDVKRIHPDLAEPIPQPRCTSLHRPRLPEQAACTAPAHLGKRAPDFLDCSPRRRQAWNIAWRPPWGIALLCTAPARGLFMWSFAYSSAYGDLNSAIIISPCCLH